MVGLEELARAGTEFCAKEWSEVERTLEGANRVQKAHAVRTCFTAAYAWVLLHSAFHVEDSQPGRVVFTNMIQALPDGKARQVNWVLGALLTEVIGPQGTNPSRPGSTTLAEQRLQDQKTTRGSRFLLLLLALLVLGASACLLWWLWRSGALGRFSPGQGGYKRVGEQGPGLHGGESREHRKGPGLLVSSAWEKAGPHDLESGADDSPKASKPAGSMSRAMLRSSSHGALHTLASTMQHAASTWLSGLSPAPSLRTHGSGPGKAAWGTHAASSGSTACPATHHAHHTLDHTVGSVISSGSGGEERRRELALVQLPGGVGSRRVVGVREWPPLPPSLPLPPQGPFGVGSRASASGVNGGWSNGSGGGSGGGGSRRSSFSGKRGEGRARAQGGLGTPPRSPSPAPGWRRD